MRAWVFAFALQLLAGCGEHGAANEAPPLSAALSAGSSAPLAATPTSSAKIANPASLARKTTPRERREGDERACEANDLAACRRAADRYRGYGHVAGCGVDRDRPKPTRKVTSADAASDAKSFDKWVRRACDLGDEEACIEGKRNVATRAISEHDVDVCARGRLEDCPLYLWQSGMHPESGAVLKKKRRGYLESGATAGIFGDLYRREKKSAAGALPKEVFDLAEGICKSTLECHDVMMMLDKNGYDAEALAPLRKSAGIALVSACLAGDCVCGEAASFLEESDARRTDLARIGCDDGEADACYWLARESEKSDEKNALALYALACPPVLASDEREEIYSKEACDRLAELNEEGRVLDKDSDRAFFYSTLACTRGGFERNHAPCIRRALFHARGYKGELRWSTMTATQIARDFFYGLDGSSGDLNECARPSVKPLCKQEEPRLLESRGQ